MRNYRIIIFVVAWLIANASSALACVCAGTTFDETFGQVKAVFSGKVVKAEYKKGIVNQMEDLFTQETGKKVDYEVLVVTFEVERWWKGGTKAEATLVADEIKLATGKVFTSNCENQYIVGEKYLIFAYADKEQLVSGACTPTNKLDKAKKELELLGEGKEPEKLIKSSKQAAPPTQKQPKPE